MRIFRRALAIGLVVSFGIGCASSAKKLNQVSVGMTKSQVIQTIGQPQSVSATDGVEYLLYTLSEGLKLGNDGQGRATIDQAKNLYFVRLRAGVVDSFGRVGDFDSIKVPETKHSLDVNIRQQ